MNKPQDPEAAETVQTTSVPAVDLPQLVVLLPCPFCGANGTYPEDMEPIGELYCQCSDDKCRTFGPSGKTWLEAGQRWNLRTRCDHCRETPLSPTERAHMKSILHNSE